MIVKGEHAEYDIAAEDGRQGELWVWDIVDSLRSDDGEVKCDGKVWDTNNLYLEYSCYSRRTGKYENSGIAKSTARWWTFVLTRGELALTVSASTLKELGREFWHRQAECKYGRNPTKGVLLPIAAVLARARDFATGERTRTESPATTVNRQPEQHG